MSTIERAIDKLERAGQGNHVEPEAEKNEERAAAQVPAG